MFLVLVHTRMCMFKCHCLVFIFSGVQYVLCMLLVVNCTKKYIYVQNFLKTGLMFRILWDIIYLYVGTNFLTYR